MIQRIRSTRETVVGALRNGSRGSGDRYNERIEPLKAISWLCRKALGLDELPVQDKLALIDELWEGIARSGVPVPISDELAAELERRLTRYRAAPETSFSAEEVRRAAHDAVSR